MKDEIIKQEMKVGEHIVGVMNVNGSEYISLTDLARYADREEPRIPIQNWMRNKDVILYLGLWESINNSDFKRVEFDAFKNEAGCNKLNFIWYCLWFFFYKSTVK